MANKINLSKTVYELIEEFPQLEKILSDLGFTEVTKKSMLNTVGKMITIPKGAEIKNIPMIDIISALMSNGFELVGEMPLDKISDDNPSVDNFNTRKEQLKDYLRRLGQGEDIESVRADFVKHFKDVDASEIMDAEQELLEEGTPLSEVQRLCDVHSALFHGKTIEENISSSENIDDEKQNTVEKDYSDKNKLAADLKKIKAHPLYTFAKENEALEILLDKYKEEKTIELFNKIRELSIHYAKKGDLLYPLLKVKYEISGPSDVMWTVDDEIRDELSSIAKTNRFDEDIKERVDAVFKRAEEMIYKEENILFPICAVNFTQDEWFGIYQDSKDYDECFGVEQEVWEEAENNKKAEIIELNDEIVMPGGHMTVEQMTAMLNTIPLEITFVDDKNINRYFNEGPKAFKRPGMAIDRDVFSCHPPKIEPMVRAIIEDFRNGTRDTVALWSEKAGKPMAVTYMAVRDKKGKYLGTMEIVQDMDFAKEHFQE
ncbi:MAG: DUF438 domain-containing protein [Clostridia bacterium]|nr:DUF438 domain-containing protein [Clostridia bacterium]